MSKESYLRDLTMSSGFLASKSVYFKDVNAQMLNGVPLSTLKNEGNDHLSPVSFTEMSKIASACQSISTMKNNMTHDYDYYLQNKEIEDKGLTGQSKNPLFKNSAIGSKAGGIFGNKINVISADTYEKTEITPFTTSSCTVLTDEIYAKSGEPEAKKIKIQNDVVMKGGITFDGNASDGKTIISRGKIVANQFGDEETGMKVEATGIQVNADIELENTKKIITSQLQADDFGTLDIKADKIHFAANEITFDPESTEITTGNFPQIITNLGDYESTQKATVYTYRDPTHKSKTNNAIYTALWRLQMFYNLILVRLKFNLLEDEAAYVSKMKDTKTKTMYVHFPSDYYPHFCDYFGKDDNDYFITNTDLILTNEEELRKLSVSVYFNPKCNNFLKMKYFDVNGKLQNWPESFMSYKSMKLSDISFGLSITTPRLKRQYQSTTPTTCMKKPDFFETLTPRKKIKVARLQDSDIFKDNVQQTIYLSEDLPSEYELQAAVSATKIHRIAFFEIRFSFVNKTSGMPVPFNDALKVLMGYDKNPKQFLITFIPSGENRRFTCSDTTNTDHIAKHPINNIKFIYNPKNELNLTKGILDFSEATEVPCDEDVAITLQFYHITEN